MGNHSVQPRKSQTQPHYQPWPGPMAGSEGLSALRPLEQAILQTVTYVDMYDFPLSVAEIHRYLVGMPAKLSDVTEALGADSLLSSYLVCHNGLYALRGREEVFESRRRRTEWAAALWPVALRYGRLIAAVPFVRMAAVTGSLAVDNSEPNADIDFFIVTETGRLWSCRAMIVAIVKAAARRDIALCPNYFLSERMLVLQDRNLYAARELAQMVPISGMEVYQRLREANDWVAEFLPNASGRPPRGSAGRPRGSTLVNGLRSATERLLRTAPGERLEHWEMRRKLIKFGSQVESQEASFSADLCKGHFDNHSRRALEKFASGWRQFDSKLSEKQ